MMIHWEFLHEDLQIFMDNGMNLRRNKFIIFNGQFVIIVYHSYNYTFRHLHNYLNH